MTLAAAGFSMLKFFPAEPAGGIAYLKALASPLPDLRFCPTGGIGPANIGGYNRKVRDAIAAGDWPRISELAEEAARLKRV